MIKRYGFWYSIGRKELLSLAKKAYGIAYSHGFHDARHSNMHYLMLCVSEIGEMVDADRRGRRANLSNVCIGKPGFYSSFERHVKNTFEDEMADVFIRILDFASAINVEDMLGNDIGILDMSDEFKRLFGDYENAERCFYLTKMLCGIDENTSEEEVSNILTHSLSFILEYARFLGIDLRKHISLKMRYNALRPPLNGKLY